MTTARADSAALALLNQDGGIAAELRFALQAFGANIVYEASLQDVDRAALQASGARTVVINLGEDEDALDDIQDLLESPDYEIIVNDSGVSAQLKGTDQARWVRHLAAKILRRPEIVLPPRPAGAQALPTFEQHWAARVPVADVIGESAATAGARSAATAAAAATAVAVQTPVVAAAAVVNEPAASPAAEPVSVEDADLEQALAHVDTLTVTPVHDASDENFEDADFARALENFDAVAETAASPGSHEGVADLEALLVAAHGHDALAQPTTDSAANEPHVATDLVDLDLHFDSIDSIDTALSAVESVVVPDSGASGSKRTPPKSEPAPAKVAPAVPNWSLATDDSDRLSLAEAAKEFGIEKVPAAVYLTPQVDEQPAEPIDPKQVGAAIPRGFAGLSLELEPLETEEDKKPKNTVAYDTGRDLELPTQVTKPVKREDDANKPKES